jgi:hypothetical protein
MLLKQKRLSKTRESFQNGRLMVEHLEVIDSKWWPGTGSNRRRRPFQGRLAKLTKWSGISGYW